jgi:hypothetical protein
MIDLDGIGRKQYGYYVDNKWHHLVFKANLATGVKEIWVDGQLPAGFSKTVSKTGTFPQPNNTGTIMFLNSNASYLKILADFDEMAFYNKALSANMIYKHYQEYKAGNHYTFTPSTVSPPAPSAVTASIDLTEYPPGHPNVTVSAIDQLKSYPAPRYKKNHTLLPNTSLIDNVYLGGRWQPGVSDPQAIANSVEIQRELATNYNNTVIVAGNTGAFNDFGNVNTFNGAWVKLANDNPNFKTAALSFWPHLNPTNAGFSQGSAYVNCGCLTDNNYMRNANNQYLDLWGNVTSTKYLSPIAPDLNTLKNDGLTQKFYLQQLTNKMTRPLNHIFENGEQIPYYLPQYQGPSKDPNVTAAKNSSGLDWYTFLSRKYSVFAKNYRDQFMNIPALANTRFTYYQIDGHDTYRQKYSEVRTVSTQINGTNYASGDLYVRFPWNWRYNSSAWNGLQFLIESRKEELKNGDKYFSPAVSAGWDENEENNLRPGQWLGLLKVFGMMGAEFYYPAYFVLQAPWPNPANYAWHSAMPAYAQSTTSFYEDLFRNGDLMDGDMLSNVADPQSGPAYMFNTGDYRKIVVVRKHKTQNKYAITGTIQNNSNMKGNAELEGPATFTLSGKQLTITIRRQGSTYIYDNTNQSNPVFYQLDGYQEAKHPSNWSKDLAIEGELYENTTNALSIKTERPVAATSGDFTNYTSYTSFSAANAKAEYNFTTRGTAAQTYYFWVRARSNSGTSTGLAIKVDGTTKNMDCIVKKSWEWYRVGTTLSNISFTNLAVGAHLLTLTANNTSLEIDKVLLTTSSTSIYGVGATNCNQSAVVANITTSGSTDICDGSTVTLTASTGSSYLWSTGAITQSITVGQAGTYIVTVFDNGGSATSSPVIVTTKATPNAAVTTNGPTTFCQGLSVKLYIDDESTVWYPGAKVGKSYTVKDQNNYFGIVTGTNGCTKKSVTTNVVVTNCNANCITPFNLALVTKTNNYARIRWDFSLTSANYNIEVKDMTTNAINTFNIGPYHNLKLYNLIAGRTYQYRVQSVCGNTTSAYSAVAYFTTNTQKGGIDNTNDDFESVAFDYANADDMYKLVAYPNPAHDAINFAFVSNSETNRTLEIFDTQGKVVYSKQYFVTEGFNTINFDCSVLKQGMYLARIFSDSESHAARITIK